MQTCDGGSQRHSMENCTGGAPRRQGCVEALIKTVKKKLFFAVGRQKPSILEVQTVLFEAANLMNSRPIGTHPIHSNDVCYLSPNEMPLGKTGGGGIVIADERNKLGHRLSLVENVLNGFWKLWQMNVQHDSLEKVDQEP